MSDEVDLFLARRAARAAIGTDYKCICEYISPGAAALHAVFHGVDCPLPKIPNPDCPIHGTGPRGARK